MRLLYLAVLAAAAPQVQDVEIGASLNRSTARVGETVLLTVTLRAPGLRTPEIEDPEFDSFELLSKNDRSTFRFSQSMGAIREFSREYTLRVLRPGELTIPPIRASVDGQLYETEALQVVAEREGTSVDLPAERGPRPGEEVAVRLWVEPETAYVGQQVTLTVGAFFDPLVRGRLQRQPEYRPPEIQGFWTADLPGSARPERRVVGRREYYVQIYRRALFPLSPGTLRIPPAGVIYEVRRGLIYAPETFQVESGPAEVVVLPLPEAGRPADFGGAVGRYEAEIWFDRSDLRAGEAVNLALEVRGSGNLSSLARPRLPEIPGVRVYEGGEDAEVQLRGVEFAGHKRFSWVLVPERAGEYVLPELRLPYFDPQEAAYDVARTEPVSLLVGPAAASTVVGVGGRGGAIRFVKAEPTGEPWSLARDGRFWALQAVPLAVLLGLLLVGRIRRHAPATASRAPRTRSRSLRDLRPLAESGDAAFFGELRTAILSWLRWRLHLPDLASKGIVQIQHALEDRGVPPPVALQVIDTLEACGRLRYAPEPPGRSEALQMLAAADRLLSLVDREAVSEKRLRGSPGPGASAGLIVIALLPLTAAGQGPGGGDAVERWFQEGVAAYERGEYVTAAERFSRALAVRPRDAALLYNLGNALYEQEQRGEAVAYWVRALRLRPRDEDARYNLRLVVGEDPVVSGALPPLPLSAGELALLVAGLWWLGWAALIARLRWRKGYLAFAGSAGLVLALAAAALLLYPRATYAVVSDPEAGLRSGPVRQSEVIAVPAEGTGYRVVERREGWLRVSRAGESEGWIERERVEIID